MFLKGLVMLCLNFFLYNYTFLVKNFKNLHKYIEIYFLINNMYALK